MQEELEVGAQYVLKCGLITGELEKLDSSEHPFYDPKYKRTYTRFGEFLTRNQDEDYYLDIASKYMPYPVSDHQQDCFVIRFEDRDAYEPTMFSTLSHALLAGLDSGSGFTVGRRTIFGMPYFVNAESIIDDIYHSIADEVDEDSYAEHGAHLPGLGTLRNDGRVCDLKRMVSAWMQANIADTHTFTKTVEVQKVDALDLQSALLFNNRVCRYVGLLDDGKIVVRMENEQVCQTCLPSQLSNI